MFRGGVAVTPVAPNVGWCLGRGVGSSFSVIGFSFSMDLIDDNPTITTIGGDRRPTRVSERGRMVTVFSKGLSYVAFAVKGGTAISNPTRAGPMVDVAIGRGAEVGTGKFLVD